MIKQLLLASLVAVGGVVMSTGVAEAGGPHRHCHDGFSDFGYYSHRPVYVAPVPVHRYPAYSVPYASPYRSFYGHGYGAPVYRSYRPAVGIGVGGGHPFYGSGFGGYGGGFGGFGGGSGFSLYIGR
jgi:hypothetical protein